MTDMCWATTNISDHSPKEAGALSRVRWVLPLLAVLCGAQLAGCRPSPAGNVLGYLVAKQLGTQPPQASTATPGTLIGSVESEDGRPIAGATVIVAEVDGTPHTAVTSADGGYRIDNVPPGQYVPAAVAPGYSEAALEGLLGIPKLMTIRPRETTAAPALVLPVYAPRSLPTNLAEVTRLRQTGAYTATAAFPENAAADVASYIFDYAGATVDTMRLYLPQERPQGARYPLLLLVYPSPVDDWQEVSVAFADQGFAVVALSPTAARGTDAEAHAQDARVALSLARAGALGDSIGDNRPVALGGSYSSAVLARLLRAAGGDLAGWVTLGGLANAFTGAADFYSGRLIVPFPYELLVPALGPPNLYPLAFLAYSPVYYASELPPTLIIHTAADQILPIRQAYDLAAAVKAAGIPLETYYYEDVSHYLGIGENLTDAGREMFYKIVEFVQRYGEEEP